MPRLVSNVGAKIPAHDTVPCRVVLLIELLLDVGGDVLLDVVLLEGLGGTIDGVLRDKNKNVEGSILTNIFNNDL